MVRKVKGFYFAIFTSFTSISFIIAIYYLKLFFTLHFRYYLNESLFFSFAVVFSVLFSKFSMLDILPKTFSTSLYLLLGFPIEEHSRSNLEKEPLLEQERESSKFKADHSFRETNNLNQLKPVKNLKQRKAEKLTAVFHFENKQ